MRPIRATSAAWLAAGGRRWSSCSIRSARPLSSTAAGAKRGRTVKAVEGPYDATKISDVRERFLRADRPVVLRGLVSTWPAVSHPSRRWNNLDRLRERHGSHVVPVEWGTDYMSAEKAELDLASFLDYLELSSPPPRQAAGQDEDDLTQFDTPPPDGEPRMYLAQHPLLDQIPELNEDLRVAEDLGGLIPLDRLYLKNAWFGPQGCVSPLHHDPYANLFLQVQGHKVWRLWDPSHSPTTMHVSTDPLQRNTSVVDPRLPDLPRRYPTFPAAEVVRCRLRPGDALYVPPKWWHHVEAATMSMSVSLWWT